MNEKTQAVGNFGTFALAYSVGWVLILLKLVGIVSLAWKAIGMYFIILALVYAILFVGLTIIGAILAAVSGK